MKIYYKNLLTDEYIKVPQNGRVLELSNVDTINEATDFSNFEATKINTLKFIMEKILKTELIAEIKHS